MANWHPKRLVKGDQSVIRFGLGFGEEMLSCAITKLPLFHVHYLLAVCDEKMLAFPLFSLPLKILRTLITLTSPVIIAPCWWPLLSFFLLFMTEEFELTSIFSDGGEGMFGLIYVCLDYASFWSGQRQTELGDSQINSLLGYDSKRWSSFELGCVHLQFIILCG